ncbi:putative uncharacterized protein DDB_G0290521 [Juglans microcarpa x Juglans regia]|uniref:putative uncharacterized protein DDB_G0290521 n=1 Tax=Juglans microcarpa x Juglans regia TaxID=2249226 RepID=UPI001B7F1BE2|nr:putative uncharacterized protein DDB_G0290521 [Juglans microcarpa x Juglans regia]
MANQAPRPRPLFRLPTIAQEATPVPAPAPAPAPAPPTEPRPPVARPRIRPLIPAIAAIVPVATTASIPSSPTPRASSSSEVPIVAFSSSVQTSPSAKSFGPSSSDATSLAPKAAPSPSSAPTSSISKAAAPQISSTTNTATSTPTTRVPSPVPPPKTIEPTVQTSPQSPNPKSSALPSPVLTLLPSQLKSQTELEQKIPMEVQEKTVVFQRTIGGEEVSNENETKEKGKSSGKTILDSMEAGVRVISIAGENKGASMKLFQSATKHEVAHKNKNPKTKSHGSDSKSGTDSNKEGNPKKNKSHKGKVTSSQPMSAFVNNNVQGINSSILYNCSCTHHDPGVHLALSRN